MMSGGGFHRDFQINKMPGALFNAPIAVPPPAVPELAIRLSSRQGDATVVSCDVAELKTIWPPTVTALP
jgi:hypothetical protein